MQAFQIENLYIQLYIIINYLILNHLYFFNNIINFNKSFNLYFFKIIYNDKKVNFSLYLYNNQDKKNISHIYLNLFI